MMSEQENIVKRTCRELGITQKELADDIFRNKVAEKLINLSSVNDKDIVYIDIVAENIEKIQTASDVRDILENEIMASTIVKRACKKLGMTQRELSEELDVPQPTLARWANGEIPKMAKMYLELLLETKELKEKFEILKKAHKILAE
jgi:transcriptional regulator with XRE-family HTH domain